MPRVNIVKKARKDQGKCGKCGTEIKRGAGYRWWKFRYGGRRVRCLEPACMPRRSELTQSPYYSALYDIQDNFDAGALGSAEEAEATIEEVAAQLEDLQSQCQESFDNIPEQLQENTAGETLQERIDCLENAISELQSIDTDQSAEEIAEDIANVLGEIY